MDKARVYFRWILTRDMINLPTATDGYPADAVLHAFWTLRRKNGTYAELYATMCSLGNIQVHIIKGKFRPSIETVIDYDDNTVNEWVAVFLNSEWRLIDVHAAAKAISGGDPGEWELIDDNGEGYKDVQATQTVLVYQADDSNFLQDPDEFIYKHFPFEEEWQLLARPVSRREFQELAFLTHSFFAGGFSIGNHPKRIIDAIDGEVEIRMNISETKRTKYMYHLWGSTSDSKISTFKDFALARFVRLERQGNIGKCKIVFPVEGQYKFELFINIDSGHTYQFGFAYLINCSEPKTNCLALPQNKRYEWGFTHEMSDLGLRPITHKHATIEVHEGSAEIRFHITKKEVQMLAKLESASNQVADLKQYVLLRQNEQDELVISVRLPENGLYALKLYGKQWGNEGSFPLVGTYLIAATTGLTAPDPFPEVPNQTTGRVTSGAALQLLPLSHVESMFKYNDPEELMLTMTSQTATALFNLTFWHRDTQEDMNPYVFLTNTKTELIFKIRFLYPGTYTLLIYAKPDQDKSTSSPHVFTYVIFVGDTNPDWTPFPTQYSNWGPSCETGGFDDGDIEVGQQKLTGIVVPGADDVAVITNDNNFEHLEKGEDQKWSGKVDLDYPGSVILAANFGEGNSYKFLLKYEAKTSKTMESEKEKRRDKHRVIRGDLGKQKQHNKKQEEKIQHELQETRADLESAIKDRDMMKLTNAILRTEKNNFTKLLGTKYEEAKQLIKTLRNVEKLKQTVLKMDQRTMAIIRSYSSPPTLVHQTMQATFLLLGAWLEVTKDWQKCQALANSIALSKRIRAFDIRNVDKETAQTARMIIDPMRYDDVFNSSEGAVVFYGWVRGMTEEILKVHS